MKRSVYPARFIGMEAHGATIKNGTNIGGAEGKAEVARFALSDGVHGKPARVACSEFK